MKEEKKKKLLNEYARIELVLILAMIVTFILMVATRCFFFILILPFSGFLCMWTPIRKWIDKGEENE
jgi:hypothetical protein